VFLVVDLLESTGMCQCDENAVFRIQMTGRPLVNMKIITVSEVDQFGTISIITGVT